MSTSIFSRPLAEETVTSPLRLAALYKSLLGSRWKSLADAVAQLSAMNIKVNKTRLQLAVQVSAFPQVILDLFKGVGLRDFHARRLVKAKAEHGLAALEDRAGRLDPTGLTGPQIIAALCDEGGAEPHRRVTTRTNPLGLASAYLDGTQKGRWESTREAAKALGISHRLICEALAIAKLPEELKACFTEKTLTRSTGKQLLELERIKGKDLLRKAALEARAAVPRLTEKALMARLAGVHTDGVELKVKRASGRLVIEFHCDADADKLDQKMHWLAFWAQRALAEVR